VFLELVTAWRLAASPTNRSPVFVNATTDGVTRLPSEFSSTTGSPPSMTAMHEFVVPKSIPITFAINCSCLETKHRKSLSTDDATGVSFDIICLTQTD
jgi:hypothetical protein